jgi:hypothetical protein
VRAWSYIKKVSNFEFYSVLDYIKKFGEGKREDFEKVLLDKLPYVLDKSQKQNKIKNNLQALRKQAEIEPQRKIWKMSKPADYTFFRRSLDIF